MKFSLSSGQIKPFSPPQRSRRFFLRNNRKEFFPSSAEAKKGTAQMNYNETKQKTSYLRADTEITGFMPYPCFLPACGLSPTAKEIYALLLHRANLSRHNNWIDELGRVFVIYTVAQLSADLGKSVTTIKTAMKELCASDLLERKHRGCGLANHLYVKLPPENLKPAGSPIPVGRSPEGPGPDPPVSFPSSPGSENRPLDSRETGYTPVGKLPPSKKKEEKDKSNLKRRFRDYSYKEGESL